MTDPLRRESGSAEPLYPQPREPFLNIPGIVLAFIALNIAIHLVRAYVLTPQQDYILISYAAFVPAFYSGAYPLDIFSFTTPVTYSLLHGGLAHLALNMVWLAAFGSPLANRIGAWRFVLFWTMTSLGAAALHFAMHAGEPVPLVGASGAISGMMGAAARYGFQIDRRAGVSRFAGHLLSIPQALSSRVVIVFLGVWFVVNLIAGFGFLGMGGGNAIAWEAHIGGFLVGFFCIGLFDRSQPDPASV